MNCALTILLPDVSRGHDTSCPYNTILFTFWVIIIIYYLYYQKCFKNTKVFFVGYLLFWDILKGYLLFS